MLTLVEKLAFIKQIVDKEPQRITSEVEQNFELYKEPDCVDMIGDHKIRLKISEKCEDDVKIRTYFRDDGNAAFRKGRTTHITREIIYHYLKVKFFGYEHLSCLVSFN